MFCYLSFYKKQYLYRLWLILCCSFIRSLCYASAFEQGLDAVKEKDYTQAIERFIQAIDDADMARDKLPLVYYNLGVCYYRMALYDNANSSFKRSMLSNTLMWRSAYSLALVAEKQQRCSYAVTLYKKIIRDADSPELIELATRHLNRISTTTLPLHTEALAKTPLIMEWSGIMSAGIGQASEVIDPKDLNGSGSDDVFNEVYAGVYRLWRLEKNRYWLVDALAYTQQYNSFSDYDVDLISVGVEHQWLLNQQWLSVGFAAERSTVGGDDYLLQYALHASSRWVLASKAKLKLSYHYRDYRALDSIFNPLEGFQHKLQIDWTSRELSASQWAARVFVTDDNREDRIDVREFSSFSAVRQGVYAAWNYSGARSRWVINMEYRNSQYQGRNFDERYTFDITQKTTREDSRVKVGLNWKYSVAPEWLLSLTYEYTDNKSNIEKYRYHGGLTSVGVSYDF